MNTEMVKTKQYIEEQEGAYRVKGKRVSLDSIVYAFLGGQSPESIAQSFPVLTLEEVYGAIAFYLANRAAIDEYLAEGEEQFETLRQQSRKTNVLLYQKLYSANNLSSDYLSLKDELFADETVESLYRKIVEWEALSHITS
ncbi:MAG: DUF433 domain-containing protein [Leptolyngbyaceae cyanobacterium bins.349]|nr:DUF433 domain-containing protein [Leptolyngbyaceae cyanobacterium bins.349]